MRRSLVALALALVLPLPVLAGQITVKEGETLSEIAERHDMSVQQLMKLNGLSNADHVQSGQTLTVPGGGGSRSSGVRASGQVTVRDGETLSEIAERHGMSVQQLMKLNGLSNADLVQSGQTLTVPGGGGSRSGGVRASGRVTVQDGETLSQIAERHGMSVQQLMKLNGLSNADHVESGQALLVSGLSKSPTSASSFRKGASEHVVRSGESLSVIANGYGIGLSKLIAINGIGDPDHVDVGTRLKLKGNPPVVKPASRPATTQAAIAQPVAARPVAPRPRSASNPSRAAAAAPVQTAASQAPTTAATPVRTKPSPAPVTATAPARAPTTAADKAAPAVQPRPSASTTPSNATPLRSPGTRLVAATTTSATATAATATAATATSGTATAARATAAAAAAAATAATAPAATAIPATATTPAASVSTTRLSSTTIAAASSSSRPSISGNPAINPIGASTRPVSPTVTRPISSSRPAATVATAPRAATTAVTAASGKPDWRTYGPLQVNWTGWQPMGGSMVAPTLNAQGQSLYLAINCGARKLNATTEAGDWKTWGDPSSDFELQLVNDYCRSRS
ncbi:MAG: LysM peptidoglycan-binding domain-containing protein [Cyanobium sp.]